MAMESWAFEITICLCGLLGVIELGAQSVLLLINGFWVQLPIGIMIASTICIGQSLGAGDKTAAITTVIMSMITVIIMASCIGTIYLIFHNQLPHILTNVEAVADEASGLLPIAVVFMACDSIALPCKGALYATGRQYIGSLVLFVTYYVLALPIGGALMFTTEVGTTGKFRIFDDNSSLIF